MGNVNASTPSPYSQLWGVVDGAVSDALKNHPDYLTAKGRHSARPSIVKRVTGTVLGFAVEAARGLRKQADKGTGVLPPALAVPSESTAAAGANTSSAAHFDLPGLIIERGQKHRRADERNYRQRVAERALELSGYVTNESAKRRNNASRASSSSRVGGS